MAYPSLVHAAVALMVLVLSVPSRADVSCPYGLQLDWLNNTIFCGVGGYACPDGSTCTYPSELCCADEFQGTFNVKRPGCPPQDTPTCASGSHVHQVWNSTTQCPRYICKTAKPFCGSTGPVPGTWVYTDWTEWSGNCGAVRRTRTPIECGAFCGGSCNEPIFRLQQTFVPCSTTITPPNTDRRDNPGTCAAVDTTSCPTATRPLVHMGLNGCHNMTCLQTCQSGSTQLAGQWSFDEWSAWSAACGERTRYRMPKQCSRACNSNSYCPEAAQEWEISIKSCSTVDPSTDTGKLGAKVTLGLGTVLIVVCVAAAVHYRSKKRHAQQRRPHCEPIPESVIQISTSPEPNFLKHPTLLKSRPSSQALSQPSLAARDASPTSGGYNPLFRTEQLEREQRDREQQESKEIEDSIDLDGYDEDTVDSMNRLTHSQPPRVPVRLSLRHKSKSYHFLSPGTTAGMSPVVDIGTPQPLMHHLSSPLLLSHMPHLYTHSHTGPSASPTTPLYPGPAYFAHASSAFQPHSQRSEAAAQTATRAFKPVVIQHNPTPSPSATSNPLFVDSTATTVAPTSASAVNSRPVSTYSLAQTPTTIASPIRTRSTLHDMLPQLERCRSAFVNNTEYDLADASETSVIKHSQQHQPHELQDQPRQQPMYASSKAIQAARRRKSREQLEEQSLSPVSTLPSVSEGSRHYLEPLASEQLQDRAPLEDESKRLNGKKKTTKDSHASRKHGNFSRKNHHTFKVKAAKEHTYTNVQQLRKHAATPLSAVDVGDITPGLHVDIPSDTYIDMANVPSSPMSTVSSASTMAWVRKYSWFKDTKPTTTSSET
eukprot:m.153404 g.153404  ORF g.153404 m.153404 type:complete len:823 (+) comp14288_c0_seq1:516-2984(+)